jgi:hypothetical protein
MIDKQRVYFLIQSDHLDPDEITRHVGVEPTRVRVKESEIGPKTGDPAPPRHEWIVESWVLNPALPGTAPLDDQVQVLVAWLDGAWERIGELTARGADALLVMARSFAWDGPDAQGFYLNPETIAALHKAGAGVWLDEDN